MFNRGSAGLRDFIVRKYIPTAGRMQYQKGNIFSARLRQLRGTRSKAVFARFLGIANPPTYHRYESGRIPDAATLAAIASRCGQSVDWLLGRDTAPGNESRTECRDFSPALVREHSTDDSSDPPAARIARRLDWLSGAVARMKSCDASTFSHFLHVAQRELDEIAALSAQLPKPERSLKGKESPPCTS